MGGAIGDLTERQIKVLNLLMEDNRLTYKAIAGKPGINESAVSDHIKALKEKGAIKRTGKTRGNWPILIKR
jgi:ATP-dependent DNA helicase RecG